MQISNIKVNGYGKLENKEMELCNGINVIKGNNEAGKSTLLSFISSMFYGASKNKNGKDISDFDKYKPWSASEFSGKIKYKLDNGEEYEVFRDFKKKAPKIYNANLEDVSDNFNIDKTKGNQFFVDQTGIDESLFFNTMTINQTEVALDNAKQNNLIQKITNVVSSGDDNVSYKKTMDKLNKKMLEEVGTNRTVGRPINVIEDEIKGIEYDIKDLELHKDKLQNLDYEKETIKNKIELIKQELAVLKEIKEYKKLELLEKQKIEFNESKLNEYKEKIENLKSTEINDNDSKKIKCIKPYILLIICIAIIGISFVFGNVIIPAIIGVLSIALNAVNYYIYSKNKDNLNKKNSETIKHKNELEIVEKEANSCKSEIETIRSKIEEMQTNEETIIKNKYGNNVNINEYIIEDLAEIETRIDNMQNEYNVLTLKENTLNIEQTGTATRLENLVKQVERLEYLEEQKEELTKLANSINYAQEGIDEAYKIMKNTVTPKFTNKLSEVIKETTGGKYSNIRFNDDEGLMVELDNGEYINCGRLSIGTIDQMYFALRLAVLEEISEQNMPVILDEAFVYYDTDRLENILKYIAKEYSNKQILILTCTNRECEALNKIGVRFNKIDM